MHYVIAVVKQDHSESGSEPESVSGARIRTSYPDDLPNIMGT